MLFNICVSYLIFVNESNKKKTLNFLETQDYQHKKLSIMVFLSKDFEKCIELTQVVYADKINNFEWYF